MANVFDEVKTLNDIYVKFTSVNEKLSDAQRNTTNVVEVCHKVLNPYFAELNNNKYNASIVCTWINNLINEYNDADEDTRLTYNDILFGVLMLAMPFMSVSMKASTYINLCVLIDDKRESNLYNDYFAFCLCGANEYMEVWNPKIVDIGMGDIYRQLGILNFKNRNYDYGIKWLENCYEYYTDNKDSLFKLSDKEQYARDYIESVIYLASCHEYQHEYLDALEILICYRSCNINEIIIKNQRVINNRINHFYCNLCDNDTHFKQCVKELLELLSPDDLAISQIFEYVCDDLICEFIHVLAHCMSEWSADIREQNEQSNYPLCSLLQLISRFFIDCIVCQNSGFVTCQATMRAENDACREALVLMEEQYKKFDHNKDDKKNGDECAELAFYLFYLSEQELRYDNHFDDEFSKFEEYGEYFKDYAENTSNDVAMLHYYVIKFKSLLKKYTQKAISHVKKKTYSEIDNLYYDLVQCKRRVSGKIFMSLEEECKRLERLYLYFRQFRYFNGTVDETHLNELIELISYYGSSDKCQNESIEKITLDKLSKSSGNDISTIIQDFISDLYFEINKINKILILAPVELAPACSYATKSVIKLLPIKQNFSNTVKITKFDFGAIRQAHPHIVRRDKQFYSDQREKWALFYEYNSQHAYLYYNIGEPLSEPEKHTMFPIVFNTAEEAYFRTLINKTITNDYLSDETRMGDECDEQDLSSCDDYGCPYYYIQESKSFSELIEELLVFLEYDNYIGFKHNTCHTINDSYLVKSTKAAISIISFPSEVQFTTDKVCRKYVFANPDSSIIVHKEEKPINNTDKAIFNISVDNSIHIHDSKIKNSTIGG